MKPLRQRPRGQLSGAAPGIVELLNEKLNTMCEHFNYTAQMGSVVPTPSPFFLPPPQESGPPDSRPDDKSTDAAPRRVAL